MNSINIKNSTGGYPNTQSSMKVYYYNPSTDALVLVSSGSAPYLGGSNPITNNTDNSATQSVNISKSFDKYVFVEGTITAAESENAYSTRISIEFPDGVAYLGGKLYVAFKPSELIATGSQLQGAIEVDDDPAN